MKFRSDRERMIVLWGAPLALLLMWWTLFLSPTLARIRRDERDLVRVRQDVNGARDVAGQIIAVNNQPKEAPHSGGLAATINNIVKNQLHFPDSHIKTISEREKSAQVDLSNIDGANVMKLMHALEQAHIRPDSATFTDYAGKHLWDISLSVNSGP